MIETAREEDKGNTPGNPQITVLICSHRKEFVLEAVESSVNQTLDKSHYEIIVVLDYYDETLQSTISGLGASVYTIGQGSWGEKLALGISVARGTIVCFLDDDDRFATSKLARIKEVFDTFGDANYVHNSSRLLTTSSDEPLEVMVSHRSTIIKHVSVKDVSKVEKLYRELARLRFDFNASSISVRKSIIDKHLELLRSATALIDSIFFYISLCFEGDLVGLSDILTEYRWHESVSNSSQDDIASLRKFADWSRKIEYSLNLAASSLNSTAVRNIITGKRLSTCALRDIFDIDSSGNALNLYISFFRFHFYHRPIYTSILLLLSVAKKVLPKTVYVVIAHLTFKSFLKII